MLGFIKQIIIQYCDLIVQGNKFLVKDAKSVLIKLSSMPEGCRYYFQKVTQLFVLVVCCFAEASTLFFTFNISDIVKSVKILSAHPRVLSFKITAYIFKKDFSMWTDAEVNTGQIYCFMI